MTAGETTRREILEQPEALRRLLTEERENIEQVAAAIRARSPKFVVMVARGTSDNAARYGQYLFGTANGLSVALAAPSLFTLYGKPPRMADALVLAVSQSGQSPDIVAVIEEGRRQGALTVAITNDAQSPLAQAAGHSVQMRANQESSVAATKTYTASLLALAMLSAELADDAERLNLLRAVPDYVAQVVERADETIRLAERYRYMQACVVLSRGYNYATAFEVALKLKELTYILAEPYSSADFKHGPVALVEEGFPVLAVVPEGIVQRELEEFLPVLRQQGAELVVISSLPGALEMARTPLPVPSGIPEWLSPVVSVVPGQLFALGLTLAKGYDADHPRGLRKVTLTE